MAFKSAVAALAALLLIAPATTAQEIGTREQTARYLERGLAVHAALGYRADPAFQTFSAPQRLMGGALWPLELQRGVNYRIYGACDIDCSDVDMELYDATGAFVDRDIAVDATPYVQITPTQTGRHYVRIWLAACESEPCFVAARVVSGGRPQERPQSGGDAGGAYAAAVRGHLERATAAAAREGFTPFGPGESIEGLRMNTRGQSVRFTLEAGRAYRFVGACDTDCTDLDIEVTDARGAVIGTNIDVDNPTSITVTPQRAGPHNVRIWLAACAQEPCYAALKGFVRGR